MKTTIALVLILISNGGFWVHYLLYKKDWLPAHLQSGFLQHFMLWHITILGLTWVEAFLLGFALAKERRSRVAVGIVLWLAQFGTLAYMLWELQGV